MTGAITALRLLLSAIMTLSALNHFLGLVPMPAFADPLASQLMVAFANSGLLSVAEGMKLIGGILLLTGTFVPFALALLMPLATCIVYITLLEGDPVLVLLALAVFALNGLLMLAHLQYYRAMLQPSTLAEGETRDAHYGEFYVNPVSRVPQRHVPAAVLVMLAAIAFYYFIVPFANGTMGLLVLIVPTLALLAGIIRGVTARSRRTL